MTDSARAPIRVTDDASRLKILDAVREQGGALTVGDVVARTGVPSADAERHLRKLVLDYESELDVADDGTLVYRFAPGLRARQDVVTADRWRRRRAAIARFLMSAFKVWTVAMVIVYAVVYAALAVAFFVAMSANQSSDNRRSRGGGGLFFLFMPRNFGGLLYGTGYGYGRPRRRQRVAHVQALDERLGRGDDPYRLETRDGGDDKPGLVDRTWYWLFGSTGERTPLEDEKELLTYIRAKKGLVTNADIMALLGVTYDEADRVGTRLVATYEGEMDLTDDGLAIYRFPNLMISGAPQVARQTPRLGYLWQLRRRLIALRSKPPWVLVGLNLFNLVLCYFTATTILPYFGWSGLAVYFWLVVFPGIYTIAFFALGGIRALRDARRRPAFERDSMRIAMYRQLFTRQQAVRIPGDERGLAAAGLGSWTTPQLTAELDAIAEEIRGRREVTPAGISVLRADRALAELRTVERLRRRASSVRPVGRTVFSSRPDEMDVSRPIEGDALAGQIEALEER